MSLEIDKVLEDIKRDMDNFTEKELPLYYSLLIGSYSGNLSNLISDYNRIAKDFYENSEAGKIEHLKANLLMYKNASQNINDNLNTLMKVNELIDILVKKFVKEEKIKLN